MWPSITPQITEQSFTLPSRPKVEFHIAFQNSVKWWSYAAKSLNKSSPQGNKTEQGA